jgi:hypothetical protein
VDKKLKQHRHNKPTRDELEEVTPPGASFNTEEGRAAQGMRADIGQGGGDTVARGGAKDETEAQPQSEDSDSAKPSPDSA